MIHVLTLTWNGQDKLEKLTPGLVKNLQNTGQEFQWYVRDNGSKDKTVDYLYTWNEKIDIEVLQANHNRANFAEGVNSLWFRAMDEAHNRKQKDGDIIVKGRSIGPTTIGRMLDDFVLLLNNDIVFGDDDSLSKMMKLMDDPEVAVVGSRLLYMGSNKLQHAGVIFGQRYGNMPYHYRHGEPSTKETECNRYFQAVTAACCLIRARDFIQMDEKFNWAFEDIDMCLRIGEKGRKIAYCGETNIYHEESATLKKNPVNKMFLQPNVKRFKDKWTGRYELDHEKYLSNSKYKLI